MAICRYCNDSAGFFRKTCTDCKNLLQRAAALPPGTGFTQLLDALEETGVAPRKIMSFLEANPDGRGSLRDRLTSSMANELLSVMGLSERQTPQAVERIRKGTHKD